MKDIQSEQRRKLLLLGGALAAQACLPMRVARAITLPPLLDLLKRYTVVDHPRSEQSLFRAAGWLPCRAATRPAHVQRHRVARVSHASLNARVVRHDRAVGLAGRNLRDNGGQPCQPLRHLGGHASRVVRGGDSPTVLGLYLHRFNLRRAVASGIPDGRLRGNDQRHLDLRQHLAADLEPAAICGPVWLHAIRLRCLTGRHGDLQVPEPETHSANAAGIMSYVHHRSPRDGACRVRARGQHDVSVGGALGKSHLHWRGFRSRTCPRATAT